MNLDILRDNEVIQMLDFHNDLKKVMRRVINIQIVIIISDIPSQKYLLDVSI